MDYERCYIFKPDDGPPTKRQRLGPQGLHQSWSTRRELFEQDWQALDQAFDEAVEEANSSTAAQIESFLYGGEHSVSHEHLPTGIILLEPGSTSRYRVKDSIVKQEDGHKTRIITLDSGAAYNLKSALKTLNTTAIRDAEALLPLIAVDDTNEEETPQEVNLSKALRHQNGRRLLAYDLQILREYVRFAEVSSVVIHFEDTEGFSTEVLSDLIQQLHLWRDRIPISLLMNVSTSVDILERRLSNSARKLLKAKLLKPASCQQEFEALTTALMRCDAKVTLGPSLMRLTAQRQADYLQDTARIKTGWKYALMSAYFANPLTAFMSAEQSAIPLDHYDALRQTASFKKEVRALLDKRAASEAKELLNNDGVLYEVIQTALTQAKEALTRLFASLRVVHIIQKHTPAVKQSSVATLYAQGLAGTLRTSASFRGMFLALRKTSRESLVTIFEEIKYKMPLNQWISQHKHDIKRLADDGAQQELAVKLCKALETELELHLIDAKALPFHEIFMWDCISPYREVFAPRPRQAAERALSTPHDYLDCDCCSAGAEQLSTQPSTSILYQLYKESGNLINVHDAWQAFQAVGGDDQEDQLTMAMFQRSLAELKHLGAVKSTKKRVDHIAKVAWPGL